MQEILIPLHSPLYSIKGETFFETKEAKLLKFEEKLFFMGHHTKFFTVPVHIPF
ncbi:Uncharacterised protein (plasmid) [Mesomycoplasma conjunctivae]|uniref:Uncharacterized protein n=1 Tax=Mycoplasmopsis fermentans (strain M64) TaxID=943945 RepID=A0AB32XBM8_MYCFM|nr:Hypothetical Protein MfeM64YM_0361 [Mycoplasmopsis fermentans M64]VEU64194.1 Uncharacterised protein [Mycoplasmopsis fermentans]VEU64200.1 Uncharacterised protein [Mycoplasmopsis fermentans]VEU67562.1 Uncharacterised protein [Mesomycoplasma conjunctivae]